MTWDLCSLNTVRIQTDLAREVPLCSLLCPCVRTSPTRRVGDRTTIGGGTSQALLADGENSIALKRKPGPSGLEPRLDTA